MGSSDDISPPKAEKSENRRLATREKLLETAYAILRDQGHAGLRSGNVSDQSGVSRGGLLHHFPTKDLLVAGVFEDIVEKMEKASWDRIAQAKNGAVIEAIVEDARSRFFGASYKILLDILVSCNREESLAEARKFLADKLTASALQGWQERLAASGVEPALANKVTCFLWNMVRGLAIRNIVQADDRYCERIIAYGLRLARTTIEEG